MKNKLSQTANESFVSVQYIRIVLAFARGKTQFDVVTADILAHQVLLNRVPEQATEDRVRYQIYY